MPDIEVIEQFYRRGPLKNLVRHIPREVGLRGMPMFQTDLNWVPPEPHVLIDEYFFTNYFFGVKVPGENEIVFNNVSGGIRPATVTNLLDFARSVDYLRVGKYDYNGRETDITIEDVDENWYVAIVNPAGNRVVWPVLEAGKIENIQTYILGDPLIVASVDAAGFGGVQTGAHIGDIKLFVYNDLIAPISNLIPEGTPVLDRSEKDIWSDSQEGLTEFSLELGEADLSRVKTFVIRYDSNVFIGDFLREKIGDITNIWRINERAEIGRRRFSNLSCQLVDQDIFIPLPLLWDIGEVATAWRVGRDVATIMLPGATGGEEPYIYSATGLPGGVLFDPEKREITGRPESATAGDIALTVTDRRGEMVEQTISYAIRPENLGTVALLGRAFTVLDIDRRSAQLTEALETLGGHSYPDFRNVAYSFVTVDIVNDMVDYTYDDSSPLNRGAGAGTVDQLEEIAFWQPESEAAWKQLQVEYFNPDGVAYLDRQKNDIGNRATRNPFITSVDSVPLTVDGENGRLFFGAFRFSAIPRDNPIPIDSDSQIPDGMRVVWSFFDFAVLRYDLSGTTQKWFQNDVAVPLVLREATGGSGTKVYSATGLPVGIEFDPATRTFTGTPTATGNGSITVRVMDDRGTIVETAFDYSVVAELTWALGALDTAWDAGEVVDLTLPVATGGTSPYTYSATALPAGLAFNANTRKITGTPTGAGTGTIIAKVTDADNNAITRNIAYTVAASTGPPLTGETSGETAIILYNSQLRWLLSTRSDYRQSAMVLQDILGTYGIRVNGRNRGFCVAIDDDDEIDYTLNLSHFSSLLVAQLALTGLAVWQPKTETAFTTAKLTIYNSDDSVALNQITSGVTANCIFVNSGFDVTINSVVGRLFVFSVNSLTPVRGGEVNVGNRVAGWPMIAEGMRFLWEFE